MEWFSPRPGKSNHRKAIMENGEAKTQMHRSVVYRGRCRRWAMWKQSCWIQAAPWFLWLLHQEKFKKKQKANPSTYVRPLDILLPTHERDNWHFMYCLSNWISRYIQYINTSQFSGQGKWCQQKWQIKELQKFSFSPLKQLENSQKIVRFSILRMLEINQKIPEIWVVVFQGKQLNLGKNSVLWGIFTCPEFTAPL